MMNEQIIHGIIIGSTIAFIAIGYALVYSVLKFINFAHGEVMMIGAYLCYIFTQVFQIESFLNAMLLTVVFTGIIGVIIEKVAYKPLRLKGRLSMLLSSLGVSIVLQAFVSIIFGSSPLVYNIKETAFPLFGYQFYPRELVLIFLLITSFFAVSIALKRSRVGLAIRAISSNPTRTTMLGIPTDRIISIIFFISSSLAAMAGISLAVESGLTPSMGFQYSIWAFAVAVIAGLGSIRGIFIGGILFGIVVTFSILYGSSLFADAIALSIMTLILLVKPQGLFPQKWREF